MAKKKEALPCLGELVCGCGRKAYVEQTSRPGDLVQVKCGHCGTDQRRGAHLQNLWRESCLPKGALVVGVDCLDYGESDPEKIAAFMGTGTTDSIPDTADTTADSIQDTEKAIESTTADSTPEPESGVSDSAVPVQIGRGGSTKRRQKRKKSNGKAVAFIGLGVCVFTAGVGILASVIRG